MSFSPVFSDSTHPSPFSSLILLPPCVDSSNAPLSFLPPPRPSLLGYRTASSRPAQGMAASTASSMPDSIPSLRAMLPMLPTLSPSTSGTFSGACRHKLTLSLIDVSSLRFNWKPAALVYPTDSKGVAAAVKCGGDNGVKVNARSGGHSCKATSVT